MAMYNRPALPRRLGLADLAVAVFVFSVLYAFLHLGSGMLAPLSAAQQPAISLDPIYLPYYAGRSLLRMFLGFGASLLFTLVY
ncbi:MAG: cmpB, partial [Firmicutes bacterium]|nr:cmpB [Bacillota bacterium]